MSRSYSTKLATKCNSGEESGTRGGWGGIKAMDCPGRRILACIADRISKAKSQPVQKQVEKINAVEEEVNVRDDQSYL